ncbi:thyroid hormone receptor beta-like isoform X2 [Argiope bruennichi]|uniref:thyroid hormone receptor beta-like isoform X2 n=1 Tax=Argiope bruennichi TaxID=94029 RepID=UPI002494FECE|nr:thyroid hormone receptor beta-like isoform X2 [Argiope bruennichi]
MIWNICERERLNHLAFQVLALNAMSLPPNGSQQSPHHHLPPLDCPSVPTQHYSSASSRRQKVCGACGDRAKSYHFGGISCDSCKAFFRRSVQNEAFKNFHCPYEGKCEITITSRKCCQYCRFQKCLSIGMETGWVMTEEERLALVKNRMERKQRQGVSESGAHSQETGKKPYRTTPISEYEPDINDLSKYLEPDDMKLIEFLVNAYEESYNEVPFSEHLHKTVPTTGRTRTEILDMFFTAVKQFTNFSQKLDAFSKIQQHDKEILLRTGVLELCFIRGAYIYDDKLARWPHTGKPMYRDSPTLDADDIKKLVSAELFEKHMEFIRSIKDLHLDEATVMLLLVIVLMSPDRPGLENEVLVAKEQEKFYILMRKYMNWRYGEENNATLYPKVLLRLPDLRELNDNHTDYNLRLASEEIQQIQQKLSSLKIDSCFQRSEGASSNISSHGSRSSTPGTSAASSSEAYARVPWSLVRDVLRAPTSPYSQEEESNSSESSDRVAPFRS